jgi:Family of unknown function (DUF6258)
MMTPVELLRTVYLGDRSCKAIVIEGWTGRVSLQVDVISRIRSPSGTWDFYADEDIPDGRLVFTEVSRIGLEPSGPVPNDLINEIRVTDVRDLRSGKCAFVFVISVSSVDAAGASTEVTIEIQAEGLHLEDPRKPGEAILS